MKASRIHTFGAPDVVVVEDAPMPLPKPKRSAGARDGRGYQLPRWNAIIREAQEQG